MFTDDPPDLPPIALIAGPTASGKSGLADALAQRTGGVVVNADSAQVYRDLRVLSARPTQADEARLPHRLYGTRDGAAPCSAADWAVDACAAVAEIQAAGRLPILVGGTGLYLRTLLDGIAPIPAIDPAVRAAVRAAGVAENHRALVAYDPAAAVKLRVSDSQRIARALEVVLSSGRSILDWQREREGGIGTQVRVVARILLPPRPWLNDRIDARFVAMFDDARQEVDALLARRLDPSLPIMNAIGVREIAAYLNGTADRDQAIAAGQAATRAYAKRQMTWFRNQPPTAWARVEDAVDHQNMEGLADDIAAGCGGARLGVRIEVAPNSNANG